MTAKAPLDGIRVIDLTMVWAGPFGARLLGDYGAEVIKVESPRMWDQLRGLGQIPRTVPRWYNQSAYFNHNNRSKRAVAMDLRSELGRQTMLKLVAESDVNIENFRADVMGNLGLDYESVKAANPNIIYVSMPGHGKTGPDVNRVAYGTNVEQLAGIVTVSGYEGDDGPTKTGFSYGDPMAGTSLVAAVAMALRQRSRTGEGSYVELAQRENLAMFVGEFIVDSSMSGEEPERVGNRHPHLAPHNRYPCAGEDRWITVACENDEQFRGLAKAILQPALADDERFSTQEARKQNESELDAMIEGWTSSLGHYEAMHILQQFGVPAGAVLTIPELMSDPHLRDRNTWIPHEHADAGTWEMEAPPWKLSRTPAEPVLPAPGFGEHNSYVLRDVMGLSEPEIQTLYDEEVVADTPDEALHQ
jgi:crotonobetainyl-CoA:carnitine CoA-transferase CaiB-like acyl-CoA transferase